MRHFFLFAVLLANFPILAQGQHIITLQESKKAVLAYSNAVKNSQLQIRSAQYGKQGAKTAYNPSVSAMAVGAWGFKDIIPAIPSFLDQGINNFYLLGVTAIQPVYTGGRIKIGSQLADLQLEAQKILATQTLDSVMLRTEQRYWNIVQLQEQYKTIMANEKLLGSILKQQQDMLASGLIARNDLLKSKVRLSQLLLDKSRLENARKVAIFDFTLLMGKQFDSLLVAQDTLGAPVLRPQDIFVIPEDAILHNTSYNLLEKSTQAQRLQTALAKAQYRPSVSMGVNMGVFGSVGNSMIGNQFMPMALATISVPISETLWGNGKYRIKQSQVSETISENNFSDIGNQLKVGVMRNWYELSDSYKQIGFARENLDAARENLKVSQDNYSGGLSDITDLLNAQAAYQQAATEMINAYASYQISLVSYKFITGTTAEP